MANGKKLAWIQLVVHRYFNNNIMIQDNYKQELSWARACESGKEDEKSGEVNGKDNARLAGWWLLILRYRCHILCCTSNARNSDVHKKIQRLIIQCTSSKPGAIHSESSSRWSRYWLLGSSKWTAQFRCCRTQPRTCQVSVVNRQSPTDNASSSKPSHVCSALDEYSQDST